MGCCISREVGAADNPNNADPIQGGYAVGDTVFFTGPSEIFPSGDRVVYGGEGTVIGSGNTDEVKGKSVNVQFPG